MPLLAALLELIGGLAEGLGVMVETVTAVKEVLYNIEGEFNGLWESPHSEYGIKPKEGICL